MTGTGAHNMAYAIVTEMCAPCCRSAYYYCFFSPIFFFVPFGTASQAFNVAMNNTNIRSLLLYSNGDGNRETLIKESKTDLSREFLQAKWD